MKRDEHVAAEGEFAPARVRRHRNDVALFHVLAFLDDRFWFTQVPGRAHVLAQVIEIDALRRVVLELLLPRAFRPSWSRR